MRKEKFINGEHYHVFNRGVDKREIFLCWDDINRFTQSMDEFNALKPIGSLFENSFRKNKSDSSLGDSVSKSSVEKDGLEQLVSFIAYCLNPNHYHFILKQESENGIEKFMHRLGVGYSMFFNNKYKRNGSLFQGKFKAVLIDSNEYLLHLSAYVNLNNKVHRLPPGDSVSKSSWKEYAEAKTENAFCDKSIILEQFTNIDKYKEFTESSLLDMQQRKEMEKLILE